MVSSKGSHPRPEEQSVPPQGLQGATKRAQAARLGALSTLSALSRRRPRLVDSPPSDRVIIGMAMVSYATAPLAVGFTSLALVWQVMALGVRRRAKASP
jgi:hypothetical protein